MDQGGAGDLAGESVSLSLSSSSGWVLSWLKKGMEKVVPQPVPSSGPAQSTAAGSEAPAQVLPGPGAEVGRVGGHRIWALRPHLPICPGRPEHRRLGSAALGAQVRPGGRTAFRGWDWGSLGWALPLQRAHGRGTLIRLAPDSRLGLSEDDRRRGSRRASCCSPPSSLLQVDSGRPLGPRTPGESPSLSTGLGTMCSV